MQKDHLGLKLLPAYKVGIGASNEPSGLGISDLKTADNRSTCFTGLQL